MTFESFFLQAGRQRSRQMFWRGRQTRNRGKYHNSCLSFSSNMEFAKCEAKQILICFKCTAPHKWSLLLHPLLVNSKAWYLPFLGGKVITKMIPGGKGFLNCATQVKKEKEGGKNILWLNAGDFYQGITSACTKNNYQKLQSHFHKQSHQHQ